MAKNNTPTPIRVSDAFGHGIFAVVMAHNTGAIGYVIPNKDTEEEYMEEATKIMNNLLFFYNNLVVVPFSERQNVRYRDVIRELKDKKFHDWDVFFSGSLSPTEETNSLPQFANMDIYAYTVGVIPQKLVSDASFGMSAGQQSLQPWVFDWLKDECKLVLLQHFHKVNDLEKVKELAEDFGMYVPGMYEDEEVFGIRGVRHKMYYNLYAKLDDCIGIAGTHTWYLLAMFPDTPMVILYREGIEDWDEIAEAARKAGRRVVALMFNDETNMEDFAEKMEMVFEPQTGYF